jgi:hypothetical protein
MAPQKTTLQILKSITGAGIAGLGMFILYENLAGAIERLRHMLVNGSEALGGLPAAILFLSQNVHTYALDHQRLVHVFFQQTLASSLWPLFLVIFGAVLSGDTFAENSPRVHKHNDAESLRLR